MDLLRNEQGLTGGGQRFPRGDTLLDIYSRSVNTTQPARDVMASLFPWCDPHTDEILDLFRAYVARKQAQSLLDFDDLLLGWRALLADPQHGPAMSARWDHRRARNDTHGYAPQSRFLDQAALSTMEIQEDRPAIPAVRSVAPSTRAALPTLDELWS